METPMIKNSLAWFLYNVVHFFSSENLQDEIEEIDDDIANIQKELRLSDSSDTSLPEEAITLRNADGRMLSDSPEF